MVKELIRQTSLAHNLINKNEHIVIGLSGGPDSVCLFHVLQELREEMGFSLYAVHVNHKFRPGAAEEDEAYVKELCRKYEIPCRSFTYDCAAMAKTLGLTSEEAGRRARYEAFGLRAEELVQEGIGEERIKVAVAQNADDQAETILLRLLRGTGPDGLAGMSYSRMEANIQIIRPLLDTWRCDIEAYCQQQGLEPRIDHTNLQPIYTRNKIRLELLPYLRKAFNPNISESLIRLGRIAGEDKSYFHQQAQAEYERLRQPSGALELSGLRKLALPIRRRVMMKALNQAGMVRDLAAAHLEQADRLLEEGRTSASMDFPGGCRMALGYGEVRFYRREQEEENRDFDKIDLNLRITILAPEAAEHGAFAGALFDWDKLCAHHGGQPEILLRTRRPGDFIRLKQGRKKIQDFFVDQKIPREQRDSVFMAAAGNEILWVIALENGPLKKNRYSSAYSLEHTTKKVLSLEIICEM